MKAPATTTPHGFDFFQLVSMIQRRASGRAEIGHVGSKGSDLGEEVVRLRPHLSLAFPPRDVEHLEVLPATAGRSDRLLVEPNFNGLYGPDSPLPNRFTEALIQDSGDPPGHDRDRVRDFLDVFHHRLYSLLFRAWQKYRYHATYRPGGQDRISRQLFALVGMGTRGLSDNSGIAGAFDAARLMRYGGLSTQRPRSAAVLRAILADHFAPATVRLRQFVPRRVRIAAESRLYLGTRKSLPGGEPVAGRRLGRDTVVGARMLDRSTKMRVIVGPVGLQRFRGLLPGTPDRTGLDALVWRSAPRHLEHDVEVILEGSEVPPLSLAPAAQARLGWTTWLGPGSGENKHVQFRAAASTACEVNSNRKVVST